jgi:hypothetical protein
LTFPAPPGPWVRARLGGPLRWHHCCLLGVGFIPVLPLPCFHDIFYCRCCCCCCYPCHWCWRGGNFERFVGRLFLHSSPRSRRLATPRHSPPHGGGINLFGPPPTSLFPIALLGTGSSATEFGGHHPLLGHLVMKHGRHKDLAKLASLVRIKRETGAWATFAIDLLPRHPPAATPPPTGGSVLGHPPPRRECVGPPPPPPVTSPHTTEPAGATGPPRPMPAVCHDAAHCGGPDAAARPAYRGLVVSRPDGGCGWRRAINPAHAQQGGAAGGVREVEDAAEDMRQRVMRFCMVYASPVHIWEHLGDLANSAFLADY